jgi:hypothetical protein
MNISVDNRCLLKNPHFLFSSTSELSSKGDRPASLSNRQPSNDEGHHRRVRVLGRHRRPQVQVGDPQRASQLPA